MDESGEEFYEKTWFYIACGAGGGVILCCLCLLCCRAHSDNSGRGTGKRGKLYDKAIHNTQIFNTSIIYIYNTSDVYTRKYMPYCGLGFMVGVAAAAAAICCLFCFVSP